jgi:Ca-activated chloride channel family protein
MKLASPLLLLLLLALPLLLALMVRDTRRRRVRLSKLADLGLLPVLVTGASDGRRRQRNVLALLAVFALVVAVAGPMKTAAPRLLPRQGLDVLFVVDVSRSMRARDVLPDRLERTKAEIAAALPQLAEHRVGVVAFAGTAFLQVPLTTDAEAARLFLSDLAPETVPQGGSALQAGLEVAANAFAAEDEAKGSDTTDRVGKAGRVVVVLSDGEDHDLLGNSGNGLDAIGKRLQGQGASVVVIGVGSTLGEPIPLLNDRGEVSGYVKDRKGATVVTRMSPEVLGKAATALGGVFVDGTATPDLGMTEVFARIATLEKRELEARTIVDLEDFSAPAVAFALLCLLGWLLRAERVGSAP